MGTEDLAATETRWLSAEEVDAWLTLLAVTLKLPTALDAQLQRDSGINHFEYGVLAGLSEAPDRTLPMSNLAGFANGSLSRLSHAVARMESRGWIEREPSPADGRITQARLTEAGWQFIQEAAPGHVHEARRTVVDVLTPAQVRQLRAIGRRILEAVDPETLRFLDRRAELEARTVPEGS